MNIFSLRFVSYNTLVIYILVLVIQIYELFPHENGNTLKFI